MLAAVLSATPHGMHGKVVRVECDMVNGLPSMTIVGLGGKTVSESKDRIRSALRHVGTKLPAKRVTINLAPADLPKDGTTLDAAIALAMLAANESVEPSKVRGCLVVGELGLDGRLQPIRGVLSILSHLPAEVTSVVIPHDNLKEAAILEPKVPIYTARSMRDIYYHFSGTALLSRLKHQKIMVEHGNYDVDFSDIHGNEQAKRAMLVAAAGHHNVLLKGPPGTGKTMLAQALVSILPQLDHEELIEIMTIYSVSRHHHYEFKHMVRPYRNPHHTASTVAIIGGGKDVSPGEVSLAHQGVLFLDELPEYSRQLLEALRQPLEDKMVTVARASDTITYPANFMLVATQNPCPCGYFNSPDHACSCTPGQIHRYQQRISGPLLDRFDLILEVNPIDRRLHIAPGTSDPARHSTAAFRAQVEQARHIQRERYKSILTNALLSARQVKQYCPLDQDTVDYFHKASEQLKLSMRAMNRSLKVARTIADLSGNIPITIEHLSEALQYRHRQLDLL